MKKLALLALLSVCLFGTTLGCTPKEPAATEPATPAETPAEPAAPATPATP